MIRVSIVEDDQVTRESLAELLSLAKGIEVLATYADAESAIKAVPAKVPDVLLVDINLPGKSGIECVAALKAALPKLQMLMLTTYDNSDAIFDSLRAGADGYLLKRTRGPELITAIKEVHEGGSPMSASIARKVVTYFQAPRPSSNPELETLTPREQEILKHLADGLHYKEIADQLGISTSTVRAHLHTIYGKLHVQSRTEAVVKYLKG
jgi:DNA-binding NarL/FixJ family response regulator